MGMKALTKQEFLEILEEREAKLNSEIMNEDKRAELIETIWMLSPIINFILLWVIIYIIYQ